MIGLMEMNWHKRWAESRSFGQRLSDTLGRIVGSWQFIIFQTVVLIVWIALNVLAVTQRWDPYPFILLNLVFAIESAYLAPIIMMSQNRQTERDRHQAEADYRINSEAKADIEALQHNLSRIESDKLEEILRLLKQPR